MIEICFQNNTSCIYKIEDWQTLRTQHRIVGELLGSNFRIPSLPLKLLPEEALLLINKGLAKLVTYPKLKNEPTQSDKKAYLALHDQLLDEQKILYKEVRKKQMEDIIDKIIEGKRRKGDQRTREEIFEEELNRSHNISEDNMLWPVLMQHIDPVNGPSCDVLKDELLKQTTERKVIVFTDLWEKGYYITTGTKFGGDFLIYLGDPVCCHAVNIVRCIENIYETISPSEVVAFGRLGTSVKKRALLAVATSDKQVSYLTLSWIDS